MNRKNDKSEFMRGERVMRNNEIDVSEICNKLKTLDFVTDVQEIGSRSEGHADCYSDVDLVVNVHNIKPDMALLKITEFMTKEYCPLWTDYANSLMPKNF